MTALRSVIQTNSKDGFPAALHSREMEGRGKSLEFAPAEIEELLSMQYGDKRLFALLSLLFSFVDLRNQFHIDHVFPISRFTAARLKRVGIGEEKIETLRQLANELPNLQLLEGPANLEKQATLPAKWLAERYPIPSDRANYRSIHLLGDVPDKIDDCEDFWGVRYVR